tara:strand:- start:54 stop:467 length:414 start_codon:yes stop_codon:yes gene_type:complete
MGEVKLWGRWGDSYNICVGHYVKDVNDLTSSLPSASFYGESPDFKTMTRLEALQVVDNMKMSMYSETDIRGEEYGPYYEGNVCGDDVDDSDGPMGCDSLWDSHKSMKIETTCEWAPDPHYLVWSGDADQCLQADKEW